MFRYIIVIALIFCEFVAKAQSDTATYYINAKDLITNVKDSATIVRHISKDKDGNGYLVHDYYTNGKLKLATHSSNKYGNVFQGYTLEYFPSGNKKSIVFYSDNNPTGDLTLFYPNGNIYLSGKFNRNGDLQVNQCRDTTDRIVASGGNGEVFYYNETFKNIVARGAVKDGLKSGLWTFFEKDTLKYSINYSMGAMVSGVGYDKIGNEHNFTQLIVPAVYKDGMYNLGFFIKRKLHYPATVKKDNVKGILQGTFVIEENGSISNVKINKGVGYGFDEEIIRVLMLTSKNWLPTVKYGMPVTQTYNFILNLDLSESSVDLQLTL